jgi:hypothetical protein
MDDEATRLKRDQLIMNEKLEERKVIVKTIHELYEFIDEAAIQEV